MAFEVPVDADFTVAYSQMNRRSLNLAGTDVTYVNTGVDGSVVLYASDGTTVVATGGDLTYVTGSNGVWTSAFDKPATSLTEGATYILVVTITEPVDDVRTIYCKARKRGANG